MKRHSVSGVLAAPRFYGALGLIALIAAGVVFPFDAAIMAWVDASNFCQGLRKDTPLGDMLRAIRCFGRADVLIVLALWLGAWGRRRRAMEVLAALLLVFIFTWSLKPTVGRVRPNGKPFSFPSGDSASAPAFFAPMAADGGVPTMGLAVIPAVAALRVVDRYHYASDALAGLGFGFLSVALALAWRPSRHRFFRRLRPRHFLWAGGALALVLYLPAFIRGKGAFLEFAAFYGPVLLFLLAARYADMVFRKRKGTAAPPIWKEFFWAVAANSLARRQSARYNYIRAGVGAVGVAMGVTLLISASFPALGLSRPATAGTGLLLLTMVWMSRRQDRAGNIKTGSVTALLGMMILMLTLWLSLFPAIQRQERKALRERLEQTEKAASMTRSIER